MVRAESLELKTHSGSKVVAGSRSGSISQKSFGTRAKSASILSIAASLPHFGREKSSSRCGTLLLMSDDQRRLGLRAFPSDRLPSLRIDSGDPIRVLLRFPLHRLRVGGLQLHCHFPGFAVAYLSPVDLQNRFHFARVTREEDLLGGVELASVDGPLLDRKGRVFREGDDGVSRNPLQDRGVDRRSAYHSSLDDEDVLPGAFADVPLVIEEEGLVVPR